MSNCFTHARSVSWNDGRRFSPTSSNYLNLGCVSPASTPDKKKEPSAKGPGRTMKCLIRSTSGAGSPHLVTRWQISKHPLFKIVAAKFRTRLRAKYLSSPKLPCARRWPHRTTLRTRALPASEGWFNLLALWNLTLKKNLPIAPIHY